MLGFGNDNKDQLKENMEEIKDLINQGKRPHAGDAAGFDHDFPEQDDHGFESVKSEPVDIDSDEDMEVQSFSGTAANTQGSQQPMAQSTESFSSGSQDLQDEIDSFDEEFGPDEPEQREEQPSGQQSQSSSTSSFDQDIPEPAKTREINVPEIDRGPLFIRRRKFERAREMVTDMRYISEEVEAVVNDIESGIQSDREMERDVRELVEAFEANRSEIEDIISPGEK